MAELNPFTIAQQQLDTAAARLGLDPATHEFLRWPQKELVVAIPVRMDDGTVKIFRGYRVQYNSARGPNKGGLRWHPDETIDTVRALAAWMTWKTRWWTSRSGGGKGGVICNPKEMSEARKAASGPGLHAGRGRHSVGLQGCPRARCLHDPPDHGLDDGRVRNPGGRAPSRRHHRQTDPAGRIRGARGRHGPRAVSMSLREAAKVLGIDLNGKTMAIQGFGNAGQYAALLATRSWA